MIRWHRGDRWPGSTATWGWCWSRMCLIRGCAGRTQGGAGGDWSRSLSTTVSSSSATLSPALFSMGPVSVANNVNLNKRRYLAQRIKRLGHSFIQSVADTEIICASAGQAANREPRHSAALLRHCRCGSLLFLFPVDWAARDSMVLRPLAIARPPMANGASRARRAVRRRSSRATPRFAARRSSANRRRPGLPPIVFSECCAQTGALRFRAFYFSDPARQVLRQTCTPWRESLAPFHPGGSKRPPPLTTSCPCPTPSEALPSGRKERDSFEAGDLRPTFVAERSSSLLKGHRDAPRDDAEHHSGRRLRAGGSSSSRFRSSAARLGGSKIAALSQCGAKGIHLRAPARRSDAIFRH